MSNQQQKPPAPMMMEAKRKQRKLPPVLRFLLYGSFAWVAVCAICYATGFWTHKDDNLDFIVSWSAGVSSPFSLLFLYLSFLWYESD